MSPTYRIHLALNLNSPKKREIEHGTPWTCAARSREGDVALLYIHAPQSAVCFVARIGKCLGLDRGHESWARTKKLYYFARLVDIRRIGKPLTLEAIRAAFPRWKAWGNLYGRHLLNIPPMYLDKLRGLLVKNDPGLARYFEWAADEADVVTLDLPDRLKSFPEGPFGEYTREAVIRNKQLIEAAKEKYGLSCQVCGLNFDTTYGRLGRGFIEVHHLKLLSGSRKKVRRSRVKDVRVVCSNCHRMIHSRKKKPLSIQTVQSAIAEARKWPRHTKV